MALRRARPVRLPARQGRRERAMASRQGRPVMWPHLEVAARHQERPVMWPRLEAAAGPGSLPRLVAAGAAAAEFERPHEM